MKDEIFNKTIETAKFDIGCGIDGFGFHCKYQRSHIDFWVTDNEQILVEDFGTMIKNKWVQYVPTKSQMSVMQKMINHKLKNWNYNKELVDPDFNGSCYNYFGVSEKDFY